MSKKLDKMLEGFEELSTNCAGASEHDAMCDEIEHLRKKVKLMQDLLYPYELEAIEDTLKNKEMPDHEDGCGYICSAEEDNK